MSYVLLEHPDLQEQGAATVGAYLGSWLDHAKVRVRGKTHDGYEGLIRLYAVPALGSVPLSALAPLHLQALYGELLGRGLSAGTVRNLHLVLTQALGQAVRWRLLPANPAAGTQPPRPRRPEMAAVDPSLAERILQAVKGTPYELPDELPAAVAIAPEMRRGEILALRWSDLDKELTTAHVRRTLGVAGRRLVFEEPKTRRSRRAVALPAFLRPYLERQREAQRVRREACPSWIDLNLVIDSGAGSPVTPGTLSSGWF